MNIYAAPNLIISPKRKVYSREWGGGNGGTQRWIHLHTHTYTLSLFLFLSPSYPPYTHTSITVSGKEGYWDGKRCVFRADLKANVELEWQSEIEREFHRTEAWYEYLRCPMAKWFQTEWRNATDGCQGKSEAVEKECRTFCEQLPPL